MRRHTALAAALGAAGVLALLFAPAPSEETSPPARSGVATRVVSLSPSVTEVLFAVGAGPVVVGVTRYCDYPAEAQTRPCVGGFVDPDYEAILGLSPDLVLLRQEHRDARAKLQALGVGILTVDHTTIGGIVDSIRSLGRACGTTAKSTDLADEIEQTMAEIQARTAGLPRKRVLISIGRTMGSGSLKELYAAGEEGFYDRLLTLAGAENACREFEQPYPRLGPEDVVRLDPDIVIDLVADLETKGLTAAAVRQEWRALPGLRAVQNGQVHVFGEGYVVIPGPRFILILERFARTIHPGLDLQGSYHGAP